MLRVFLATCCVTMLMGCASSSAVKDVTKGDPTQYWVLVPSSIPHDTPLEDGCMRVQAVIGSDGKVSDPKVLAVVGLGVAAWIPKGLPQLRYDPAPGNTARTPIRTIIVWTFNYPQSIEAASDATTAQEMQARLAAGPTPEASAWRAKCDAEMDQQMGITKS